MVAAEYCLDYTSQATCTAAAAENAPAAALLQLQRRVQRL